jgi:hypothetical protein
MISKYYPNGKGNKHTQVYFGKVVLCEGEVFKAVVDISHDQALENITYIMVLRLADTNNLADPSTCSQELGRVGLHKAYFNSSKSLKPGSYIAKVYSAPLSLNRALKVNEEALERYLIGEQTFCIFEQDKYAEKITKILDECRDHPTYLDDLSLEDINALLNGFSLKQLPQNFKPENHRGYGIYLILLFRDILTVFMTLEIGPLPFKILVNCDTPNEFPHIDVYKFVWVVRVLSATWADLLLFDSGIILYISVKKDSLSLTFKNGEDEVMDNEDQAKASLCEPPIFNIVRNSIGDSINMDLSYKKIGRIYLSINEKGTYNRL